MPTCQTIQDLERLVSTGIALLYLDDRKTYVGLYSTQLAVASTADQMAFTGWHHTSHREVACCVEVDRQTLQGYLSLGKEMRSAD